ncbi:uncharacterized protein Z520_09109 [Fonsecaea multimorphosa CBS 102226]|uniref:Class II aldolase/adducin N-terminal domain-containing protein n=1 Tax=Fonsecaea multimorphosa CBS 102226 TaxID=1442371 RepID=A0A0D2KER9_9EURO|nr:uncharacterized protein Z520_09109 [Fonsecaea multimorphosa CBS 102226]KIX95193.1 hypothetical protein Z520_09109 [Fonsecaea multimorphosa CBS 102226]OAL20909.1 hypothetical protein AYO22_08537 [Fonsecaea multimorphosa]
MDIQTTKRTLITANHILHHQGQVLDAYGHISVRHPANPSVFLMARYVPAALLASPDDIVEYRVEDAEPVDMHAPKGYTERFIHSELYKRFTEVRSVCHSHAREVIPWGLLPASKEGCGLKACVNTSGFLGKKTPVFEPRPHFRPGDIKDLLIRSEHLGAALAALFTNTATADSGGRLDRSVVLMRGHGMTVAAASIEHCVFRSIYTRNNAIIQTTAVMLRSSLTLGSSEASHEHSHDQEQDLTFLDDDEVADCTGINVKTVLRPWTAWSREVQANPLYVNLA